MRTPGAGRKPRRWKRWLAWLLLAPLLASVLQVALLRFVDPPFTSFMAIRQARAWLQGDFDFGIQYQWRDPERIAPCLPLAVIAGYYGTMLLGPTVQMRYVYPVMLALPYLVALMCGTGRKTENEKTETEIKQGQR